jgi:hypothetical protein
VTHDIDAWDSGEPAVPASRLEGDYAALAPVLNDALDHGAPGPASVALMTACARP